LILKGYKISQLRQYTSKSPGSTLVSH